MVDGRSGRRRIRGDLGGRPTTERPNGQQVQGELPAADLDGQEEVELTLPGLVQAQSEVAEREHAEPLIRIGATPLAVAELEEMDGTESHYDAKFTVLAENVRHHIKEEEENILPKTQKMDIDFDALGEEMRVRKEELMSEGMSETGEADMVAQSGGHGDSPAAAAKQTAAPAKKTA